MIQYLAGDLIVRPEKRSLRMRSATSTRSIEKSMRSQT